MKTCFDFESKNYVHKIKLNDNKNKHTQERSTLLDQTEIAPELEHEEENTEDPLNQYRSQISQTCLVSLYPDNEREYIEMAPGEGKKPLTVLQKEKALPYFSNWEVWMFL